jgi:hypothetical protein
LDVFGSAARKEDFKPRGHAELILIKFESGDGSIQCLIQAVPYDRAKTIDTMIIPK